MSMSLFSSFIFSSNSFLSWIDKSALGLAGVSIGAKLLYFSPFRFAVYCNGQFCRHQSPFQKSHTLLYTSLVNLANIQPSLRFTIISLVFLYQFLFLSHMLFYFLLGGSLKFWLSTKILTFSANILSVIFCYWHACAHAEKKLHREGKLSHVECLY